MVLSNINNYSTYSNLHPFFLEAFSYLKNLDTQNLKEGKTEISGNDLFAIFSKPGTITDEHPKLEAHKKYIDIHYIIEGTELFGWKNLSLCKNQQGMFDEEKDFVLYDDQAFTTVELQKHNFVIVYPDDAHAPGLKAYNLHKVVLKIKI